MSSARFVTPPVFRAFAFAAACIAVATNAQAAPFELIYAGYFTTAEALNLASAPAPLYFAGTNPFTISARFEGARA